MSENSPLSLPHVGGGGRESVIHDVAVTPSLRLGQPSPDGDDYNQVHYHNRNHHYDHTLPMVPLCNLQSTICHKKYLLFTVLLTASALHLSTISFTIQT